MFLLTLLLRLLLFLCRLLVSCLVVVGVVLDVMNVLAIIVNAGLIRVDWVFIGIIAVLKMLAGMVGAVLIILLLFSCFLGRLLLLLALFMMWFIDIRICRPIESVIALFVGITGAVSQIMVHSVRLLVVKVSMGMLMIPVVLLNVGIIRF